MGSDRSASSLVAISDWWVFIYPRAEWWCLSAQGEVFSAVWSPDDPLTLAAAGSKAKLQIWDVGANFGARKVFGTRLSEAGRALKEKKNGGVIGVADDEDDEDDSNDED